MTSIVVGHSRDPASQEALRVARDLAERLEARLHVVHGVDLGDYPINPDAADWEEQGERTLAEQQDQVQTALATCPQGWTYSEAIDGDALRRTCYQESSGWSVLLAPNSNECESALKTNDPRATPVDCAQVPGW